LASATFEELIAIDEIGDRIAESILMFFNDEENKHLIQRLKDAGLNFEIIEKEGTTNKFEGKSFVVSGVFNVFSRTELKEVIEINGGKNVSSISAKTDFVIAGDKMGPAKLKKATDLEITILSEDDFIKILNE
jgi:DNA ligase (NAD+)